MTRLLRPLPWFLAILAPAITLTLLVPAAAFAGTRTVEVGDFTEIDVDGAYELTVEVGPGPVQVRLSGPGERWATARVRGERLHLGMEDRPLLRDGNVHAEIRVPSLAALRIDGAVKADVRGVQGDRLRLDNNGAAEVRVSGRVGRLEVRLDGVGDVDALDLKADDVVADVNGTGRIDVCAAGRLEASVNGVGRIAYDCDPAEVEQEVNGLGRIARR